MSQIADDNYFVVNGWMINKLNLSGTELMTFAIIYGFCQHDNMQGEFRGSLQYLADFTGSTKATIIKVLKSLGQKGYINKSEYYQNNVKFCTYKINTTVVNNYIGGIKNIPGGGIENCIGGIKNIPGGGIFSIPGGGIENIPNNIYINNNNINKSINNNIMSANTDGREVFNYKKIVDLFNEICVSLPKVKEINDERKRKIKNADKKLNGDYKTFFEKVENSDFLSGRNGAWRNCCFDWIFKPANITKILEGNYDNRERQPTAGTGTNAEPERDSEWGRIKEALDAQSW